MVQPRQSKKAAYSMPRVLVVGVVVIVAGIAWDQYEAKRTSLIIHSVPTITNNAEGTLSTETPKPDEFDRYKVAGDLPRYLFIPKIGVKAMVKPMGVTAKNQIEAPPGAFDAGWYNKSAKPGEQGASLLDGHVSGGAVPGIFYNLKNLTLGDELTLERGDGLKVVYKVVKSQTYDVDKVDMAAVLAPVNADKPGLNLITCTGNVMKGTNNYDKRIVVFTEQV